MQQPPLMCHLTQDSKEAVEAGDEHVPVLDMQVAVGSLSMGQLVFLFIGDYQRDCINFIS